MEKNKFDDFSDQVLQQTCAPDETKPVTTGNDDKTGTCITGAGNTMRMTLRIMEFANYWHYFNLVPEFCK